MDLTSFVFDSPLPNDMAVAIITASYALRRGGWLILTTAKIRDDGKIEGVITLFVSPEGVQAARVAYPTATVADLSATTMHLALLAEQKEIIAPTFSHPSSSDKDRVH
jgi:hypothetical protein